MNAYNDTSIRQYNISSDCYKSFHQENDIIVQSIVVLNDSIDIAVYMYDNSLIRHVR